MRTILHIDMDAFYASVEQRDDPSLRNKPVLVGGRSRRGVVAAASYEARAFGARSAMPMTQALQRCPDAIVVPPNMAKYAKVSAQVFEIFRRFTPLVEGLSFDEAFLDVTGSLSLFGDGEAVARKIKAAILEETGLTASAGVAPCKFVAKIASDFRKPNGLFVVKPEEVVSFLAPLPIETMWGVGKKTAPKLRDAGFRTLGDLAKADPRRLEELLGSFGPAARALAQGIDPREVVPDRDALSIGAEETFEHDLFDLESLERALLAQASRVAFRLSESGRVARVVVVKIKYADFSLKTRRTTLPAAVADTQSIYAAARDLLRRFSSFEKGVRLVGVAAGELSEASATRTLFPDEKEVRARKLEEVRKEIAHRFGKDRLTLAALLDKGKGPVPPSGKK